MEVVTGRLGQFRLHPAAMVVPPMVHELEHGGDPSGATFDHRPLEPGKTHRCAAPDYAHHGVIHRELDHADVDSAGAGAVRDSVRLAPAQVHAGDEVEVLKG